MLEYWRFFRRETSLLTYGVSLTFLSSVGQTFLVSLFVPHFLEAFALTEGGFGLLYSGATLGSALLLPWVGQLMDREHLHRFTLGVVGLLAGSAFLMAGAWHVAVLGVALLGVRLGGQGLSSHTALTAMARYFEAGRGKALSISNLGFPLGEGVLPLLLTGALAWVGWRWTWVALGAAVVLSGPLLLRLLRRSGVEMDPREAVEDGEGGRADREGSGGEQGERSGTGRQANPSAGSSPAGSPDLVTFLDWRYLIPVAVALRDSQPAGDPTMSVAKVTEITATSTESFEDAMRKGIERASKTLDQVQGAWVKEQKVTVEDGKIATFRVVMKVTFLLKE